MGNWDNRDSSTFTKKIPNVRQIKASERIAESMIAVDPDQCPIEFLWEYNCAVYATARAWKAENTQLKTTQTSKNEAFKPKWLLNIEKEMQQTRKEISQLTEEIKRLKTNGKLTKKLRRNRYWMKADIKAPIINLAALITLKEEKINFIRKLKLEKQRKLKASESRKINQLFDQNEGSFYKDLRSKLDQQKETSSPLYK